MNCIAGRGPVPILPAEIIETPVVTFAVHASLNHGAVVGWTNSLVRTGRRCY
jgi:hypothetical protein